MRAIVRNRKVIRIIQGSSNEGLPIISNYIIPEPSIFYHVGMPTYEISETQVIMNRVISEFTEEYCRKLIKKELKNRRISMMGLGLQYDGKTYHSDDISLIMIKLLPVTVAKFKHKNGWINIPNTNALKSAVDDHIQNAFLLEGTKSEEVDLLNTFEELVEYYLTLTGE